MDCNGIWVVEMKGPYCWERIGTAFMNDGKYLGAGPNHYAVGDYKKDGNSIEMSIKVTQHGELRTIFGRKSDNDLQVTSKLKVEKNRMIGISKAKGRKNFDVMIRLVRIGNLN